MAEYMQYDWRTSTISHTMVNESSRNGPIDKTARLTGLRERLQQTENSELKNNIIQDDATLLKFLYARKFDVDQTFQLMHNYYCYRKKNQDIFKDFTIEAADIASALENGLPGVLASKDRKGRCVLTLQAINWDCANYSLISIYRAILLSLEHLTNDVYNQTCGFVMLVDWTEFSFRQSTHLKPSTLRLMLEGLQDCFPARFKGIHFIGQPWYVETALALIKPFLKDKTKARIYLHGNNLSTLHDLVHKDILPAEFGGEQSSYNPQTWLNILKNN